jgi:hypothetical protein
MRPIPVVPWLGVAAAVLPTLPAAAQQVLEVGPGLAYARPEAALAAAHAGDRIEVHPAAEGAYSRVALLVRVPNLTIVGVGARAGEQIRFDGAGFNYSGVGSVPRAIVQFDPEADGCVLAGFELSGASNDSHNGAGVRINQADSVAVRACVIHDNNMGIMSNGGPAGAAAGQRIDACLIHSNGAVSDPGFSHNLYLGGTSAVLRACEVRSSTAGHNIKSRAHYTRVEYCWVHDSANRELDLVDAAGDTDVPGSHAVVLGCLIQKSPNTSGNRGVINFGQDGGHDHAGTLFIVNTTVLTPYVSPVVTLSAPGASLFIANTLFTDAGSGQRNQVLAALGSGGGTTPLEQRVRGIANAATRGFLDPLQIATRLEEPVRFTDPAHGDLRVESPVAPLARAGKSVGALGIPAAPHESGATPGVPLERYIHPRRTAVRPDSDAPGIGGAQSQPTSDR